MIYLNKIKVIMLIKTSLDVNFLVFCQSVERKQVNNYRYLKIEISFLIQ